LEKLIEALVELEKREVQTSQSWFNMGVVLQSFSKLIADEPDMSHNENRELSVQMENLARSMEQVSNLSIKKVQVVSLMEQLLELKRTGPAVKAILNDRSAAVQAAEVARKKLKHKRKPEGMWDRDESLITEEMANKADAELEELTFRVLSEWGSLAVRKVNTLKYILRSFVEREIEFHEQSVEEFKKLKVYLA